jgi:hypothetical protein
LDVKPTKWLTFRPALTGGTGLVREKALLEQWKYLKELGLNASERADSGRRGT